MADLGGHMLHESVSVDIAFTPPGPGFGDLFQIYGSDHPTCPPTAAYRFGTLADLGFSQQRELKFGESGTGPFFDVDLSWHF